MKKYSKKIRRIIQVALLILVVSSTCYAASLEVTWDTNTEPDLASYKLYSSFTNGIWGFPIATIAAPTTIYTIPNITDGTYYIALSAVDTAGNESEKAVASITVNVTAPVKPTGLKLLLKN
jgi:hypothetical protein